jgi:hypothetical protein
MRWIGSIVVDSECGGTVAIEGSVGSLGAMGAIGRLGSSVRSCPSVSVRVR